MLLMTHFCDDVMYETCRVLTCHTAVAASNVMLDLDHELHEHVRD